MGRCRTAVTGIPREPPLNIVQIGRYSMHSMHVASDIYQPEARAHLPTEQCMVFGANGAQHGQHAYKVSNVEAQTLLTSLGDLVHRGLLSFCTCHSSEDLLTVRITGSTASAASLPSSLACMKMAPSFHVTIASHLTGERVMMKGSRRISANNRLDNSSCFHFLLDLHKSSPQLKSFSCI